MIKKFTITLQGIKYKVFMHNAAWYWIRDTYYLEGRIEEASGPFKTHLDCVFDLVLSVDFGLFNRR